MTRRVACVLAASLMITCAPIALSPNPTATDPSSTSRSPRRPDPVRSDAVLTLHAMSWSRNATPHEQILFEGGEPNAFTELRLLGPDGATIASASSVPRALEAMQVCPGSKTNEPAPVYGALRVTLSLASQAQLSDVIGHPERYRVVVLANGKWQQALVVFECHAQE